MTKRLCVQCGNMCCFVNRWCRTFGRTSQSYMRGDHCPIVMRKRFSLSISTYLDSTHMEHTILRRLGTAVEGLQEKNSRVNALTTCIKALSRQEELYQRARSRQQVLHASMQQSVRKDFQARVKRVKGKKGVVREREFRGLKKVFFQWDFLGMPIDSEEFVNSANSQRRKKGRCVGGRMFRQYTHSGSREETIDERRRKTEQVKNIQEDKKSLNLLKKILGEKLFYEWKEVAGSIRRQGATFQSTLIYVIATQRLWFPFGLSYEIPEDFLGK